MEAAPRLCVFKLDEARVPSTDSMGVTRWHDPVITDTNIDQFRCAETCPGPIPEPRALKFSFLRWQVIVPLGTHDVCSEDYPAAPQD